MARQSVEHKFQVGDRVFFKKDLSAEEEWEGVILLLPRFSEPRYGVKLVNVPLRGHNLHGLLKPPDRGWYIDHPVTMRLTVTTVDTVSVALDYLFLMETKDELGLE
jgi:hypothetical protein